MDGLAVGRGTITTVDREDRRQIQMSTDRVIVMGDFQTREARTRSLTSPRIETNSIILGAPGSEGGEATDDGDGGDVVIRPPGEDIPEPDLPDPVIDVPDIRPLPDPPLPGGGLLGGLRPGAGRVESAEGPEDVEQTAGRITLRDGDGENSIVLDAASGRILLRGVGDLLGKIAELEARIAELEG